MPNNCNHHIRKTAGEPAALLLPTAAAAFYLTDGVSPSEISALERRDEVSRDLVDCLSAINFRIDAGFLVVVDEGLRGSLIDGEAILHRLRRVIGTLEEFTAARVADALFFRRVELDVIGGAALLADAASRCALDEVGCGNVDVEDARELEPKLLEDAVEGVRLTVRGKPSRMKPFLQSSLARRSRTIPMVTLSGTSLP